MSFSVISPLDSLTESLRDSITPDNISTDINYNGNSVTDVSTVVLVNEGTPTPPKDGTTSVYVNPDDNLLHTVDSVGTDTVVGAGVAGDQAVNTTSNVQFASLVITGTSSLADTLNMNAANIIGANSLALQETNTFPTPAAGYVTMYYNSVTSKLTIDDGVSSELVNPNDQILNTTSNATFANLTATGNLQTNTISSIDETTLAIDSFSGGDVSVGVGEFTANVNIGNGANLINAGTDLNMAGNDITAANNVAVTGNVDYGTNTGVIAEFTASGFIDAGQLCRVSALADNTAVVYAAADNIQFPVLGIAVNTVTDGQTVRIKISGFFNALVEVGNTVNRGDPLNRSATDDGRVFSTGSIGGDPTGRFGVALETVTGAGSATVRGVFAYAT